LGNVFGIAHLVRVDIEVNVGFNEKDVINYSCRISILSPSPYGVAMVKVALTLVLAPFAITRRLVMNARQEAKVLEWHLLLLDAELVVKFSLGSALDAVDGVGQVGACLAGDTKRV
jgi:hypothetical protein